ncbi:MAG: hypothetical protein SNJ58_15360 [Aggregatilineales bacterium]
MSPNLDAMLRSAIEHVKANRKAEARRLLEQIVSVDQMNEQAWLWLSACVDTAEEQAICLENVLDINPNNQKAIKGLQALQARHAPPAADPFASSPFSSAPAADPFADSPFSSTSPQLPATPTSVEWGKSSGSAPARGSSVPAFSDEDYDAWLANLPLGTSNSVFTSTSPTEAAPFPLPADQFADDLDNFDFSSVYTPAPSPSEPTELPSAPAVSPFGEADVSPFVSSTYEDSSAPFSAFDEVLFEEPQPDLSLYEPPESLESRPFEEGDDVPLTSEDVMGSVAEPVPVIPPRLRNVPPSLVTGRGRSKLGSSAGHHDPSDPFSRIPAEIEAGSVLSSLPIGVIALAGLNAVAAIVLIINLFSS